MKKGDTTVINGDRWTVVDVAPAEPLAEMVAAILEEEGFVVMIRGGLEGMDDVFSHLGALGVSAAAVLVPERDAERALAIIAETVTDYEGEDLEEVLREMGDQVTVQDLEALGLDLGSTGTADASEDGSGTDRE